MDNPDAPQQTPFLPKQANYISCRSGAENAFQSVIEMLGYEYDAPPEPKSANGVEYVEFKIKPINYEEQRDYSRATDITAIFHRKDIRDRVDYWAREIVALTKEPSEPMDSELSLNQIERHKCKITNAVLWYKFDGMPGLYHPQIQIEGSLPGYGSGISDCSFSPRPYNQNQYDIDTHEIELLLVHQVMSAYATPSTTLHTPWSSSPSGEDNAPRPYAWSSKVGVYQTPMLASYQLDIPSSHSDFYSNTLPTTSCDRWYSVLCDTKGIKFALSMDPDKALILAEEFNNGWDIIFDLVAKIDYHQTIPIKASEFDPETLIAANTNFPLAVALTYRNSNGSVVRLDSLQPEWPVASVRQPESNIWKSATDESKAAWQVALESDGLYPGWPGANPPQLYKINVHGTIYYQIIYPTIYDGDYVNTFQDRVENGYVEDGSHRGNKYVALLPDMMVEIVDPANSSFWATTTPPKLYTTFKDDAALLKVWEDLGYTRTRDSDPTVFTPYYSRPERPTPWRESAHAFLSSNLGPMPDDLNEEDQEMTVSLIEDILADAYVSIVTPGHLPRSGMLVAAPNKGMYELTLDATNAFSSGQNPTTHVLRGWKIKIPALGIILPQVIVDPFVDGEEGQSQSDWQLSAYLDQIQEHLTPPSAQEPTGSTAPTGSTDVTASEPEDVCLLTYYRGEALKYKNLLSEHEQIKSQVDSLCSQSLHIENERLRERLRLQGEKIDSDSYRLLPHRDREILIAKKKRQLQQEQFLASQEAQASLQARNLEHEEDIIKEEGEYISVLSQSLNDFDLSPGTVESLNAVEIYTIANLVQASIEQLDSITDPAVLNETMEMLAELGLTIAAVEAYIPGPSSGSLGPTGSSEPTSGTDV